MSTNNTDFLGLWTHSCGSNNALWYGSTLEAAAQEWQRFVANGETDVALTAYGAGTVATHAEMAWRYGTPKGTFSCPICGTDTPHQHSAEAVAFHRDNEAWRQRRMEKCWQEIEARIAKLARRATADVPGADGELPTGAVVEGYCIDPVDGLRYPYGSAADGTYWIADQFAWAGWRTREARDKVLTQYRRPDVADTTTSYAAIQFWAIEASAQVLEAAAQGFCEVAPGDVTASGLADSYGMAANEVRLQIPAYAQMKERNLAAIKAWDKASAPPELEQWAPMKYAPGGLGPDSDAYGVPPIVEMTSEIKDLRPMPPYSWINELADIAYRMEDAANSSDKAAARRHLDDLLKHVRGVTGAHLSVPDEDPL